jgi:hypothetical protein
MYRRAAKYNKKGPTSAKAPYLIFNPHDIDSPSVSTSLYPNNDPWIQITAIDPGIKNCALHVMRRTDKTVQTLALNKFNFTISSEDESNTGMDTMYYKRVLEHLSLYMDYFITSQYIIIESQLPINYDMVRLSQHIISFLMLYTRNQGLRPLIIEIDPKFKSKLFQAPPHLKYDELKKWAWENAVKILKEKGDHDTANIILKSNKKDDYGDVVCYTAAWDIILNQGLYVLPLMSKDLLKTSK